jgi:hypothetical protein
MPAFIYEFDRDGHLLITNEHASPFFNATVNESQLCALSTSSSIGQGGVTITVRDLVSALGTTSGGQHAGQPMPGDPVNWCELPYFRGDLESARLKGEGASTRGVVLAGDSLGCRGGPEAISAATAEFRLPDGSPLAAQPRRSYYSSGLAVDLKFDSATSE